MPDMTIVVPSSGRPDAVSQMADAFGRTCLADTHLLIAVDQRERADLIDSYAAQVAGAPYPGRVRLVLTASTNMVEALNHAAGTLLEDGSPPRAVGFMGDDHRPRTVGWDTGYLSALDASYPGLVYGNDGCQGRNLPTQVAMATDLVRAWGWMAPPVLHHMYVDNFWRDAGQAIGTLTYLPDVMVEHLHPLFGRGQWDPGYLRVNAPEVYERDHEAYATFIAAGGIQVAVRKANRLRGIAVGGDAA